MQGCSPYSDEKRQAPPPVSAASSKDAKTASISASPSTDEALEESAAGEEIACTSDASEQDESNHGNGEEPSTLSAPADEIVAIPSLTLRPLPPIFKHLQDALME